MSFYIPVPVGAWTVSPAVHKSQTDPAQNCQRDGIKVNPTRSFESPPCNIKKDEAAVKNHKEIIQKNVHTNLD